MDTSIKEGYIKFDKSELKGRLEKVAIKYHMISFQLQGDKQEYLFDPNISLDEHIFNSIAERGDSIINPHTVTHCFCRREQRAMSFLLENLKANAVQSITKS